MNYTNKKLFVMELQLKMHDFKYMKIYFLVN